MRGLTSEERSALTFADTDEPFHSNTPDGSRLLATLDALIERGCVSMRWGPHPTEPEYVVPWYDVTPLGRLALRVSQA